MAQLFGESIGAAVVRIVILLLASICISFLYLMFQFRGLNSAEAMDEAQLARNLAEGRGYTTDNIAPLALWMLQEKNPDTPPDLEAFPDVINPPVYPFLLSVWLKIWQPEYEISTRKGEFEMYGGDTACAVFGCVWFVLGLLALFGWTATMTDPKLATLVAALALFCDYLWQWAISGTSWSLLFFLTVVMGWLIYLRIRSEGRGAVAWLSVAGIGVVLGVGFLTRYTFALWLIPVLMVLLIHGDRSRFRDAAIVVGVGLVLALPWCVRNIGLTGSPVGLAAYAWYGGTDLFPGPTLPNVYQPDFDGWEFKHLAKKWMRVARQMWETDAKLIGGNWMVCFFVAACFYAFKRPELQRMKWFAIYAVLAFVAVLPLIWLPSLQGVSTQDLWSLLPPFVFVFGAIFFKVLIDRWESHSSFVENLALVLFVALNSFGFFYALGGPKPAPFRYPPYYPPVISQAAGYLMDEPVSVGGSEKNVREWMMTDMPWAVAWYGRKPAVGLTYTIEDLLKIHDNLKEFSAVFLTPVSSHRDLVSDLYTGELKEWMPIIVFRQIPKGFPLVGGVPMGPDFIVLTDPARVQPASPTPQ